MTLTLGLSITILILGTLLVASVYYNWKFAKIILSAEDAIEESLDVFDTSYAELAKLAEKEIFFDSPEIRHAIDIIRLSRDSVHFVASTLASFDDANKE